MSVGLPTDLTWYKLATDLGSLIGGVFALLAGVAAYFAGLRQARATRKAAHDQIEAAAAEITNTDAATAKAILREIIECNKVTMEGLRICGCIKSGLLPMTRKNAQLIMMSPDPIVYKAVAHRIGRLPYDLQAVVHFYMRVEYIQHNIQTIVVGPGDNVSGEEAETLARSLIIICQLVV